MSTKSYPKPRSYSELTCSGEISFRSHMTMGKLTTKAGSTHAEKQLATINCTPCFWLWFVREWVVRNGEIFRKTFKKENKLYDILK